MTLEKKRKSSESFGRINLNFFFFFPFLCVTDVEQVDDMTADLIISQLLFLDAEDSTKDIKLFINSPGGSVTAGMLTMQLICLMVTPLKDND